MARQAPRPNHEPFPKWLALTLLSGLLVVTLIVVALAVSSTRGESPNAGTVPSTSQPDPEPEEDPEPEPEPEAPAYAAPAMQRLLSTGSAASQVLRALAGTCPDPAGSLEVSFDGGSTWLAGVTASVDARRLLQLDATGGDFVRMVVLDADCAPQIARSFVGGTSWELDPDPGPVWYIDPGDAAVVHAPAGAQTLPCQAVGLSTQASRGAVLCSDSTVLQSESGGAAWSAPVAVPNGAAVGVAPEGIVVASLDEPDCVGMRTRLLAGGELGSPGACLEVSRAEGGQAAVVGAAGVWYLWAGEAFARSTDLGQTWG